MDYEFNFQLEIRAPYLLAGPSNFSHENFLKVHLSAVRSSTLRRLLQSSVKNMCLQRFDLAIYFLKEGDLA